jgi:hypothetical protein
MRSLVSTSRSLDRTLASGAGKRFHLCFGMARTPFTPAYETLKTDPAWTVRSLPTTHDIIRHAPEDLISIVLGLKELQ